MIAFGTIPLPDVASGMLAPLPIVKLNGVLTVGGAFTAEMGLVLSNDVIDAPGDKNGDSPDTRVAFLISGVTLAYPHGLLFKNNEGGGEKTFGILPGSLGPGVLDFAA